MLRCYSNSCVICTNPVESIDTVQERLLQVVASTLICQVTVSRLEITGIMIEALGVALVHPDILAILPLLHTLYSLLLTHNFASFHAHIDTVDLKFVAARHT